MTGLRIKLGSFELELSEGQTDNVTFIIFIAMIATAVLVGLVILT